MNTSRRFRIVLPLVSIVTAFALSAQAQEQPKGPPPRGEPGKPGAQAAHPGPGRPGQRRLSGAAASSPFRSFSVLLRAALRPDGDEEGDRVVHQGRIGAGASKCSPTAVSIRQGRAHSLYRPVPVESLHPPVRRRPHGDHPRWGAGEYALLEAESAVGRCEQEEARLASRILRVIFSRMSSSSPLSNLPKRAC